MWEKPEGLLGGGAFSSGISRSACASIFDMLHSFAPSYSHPSIRHLQPSLMLGPCKTGQRRAVVTHRHFSRGSDVSWERQANMKNPAGPKVRAETFYDVSSWQQVTKTITLDSGASCQNQNNLYRVFWKRFLIPGQTAQFWPSRKKTLRQTDMQSILCLQNRAADLQCGQIGMTTF